MSKYADHDAYIAAAPEHFQPLLQRVRSQLTVALPGLEPLISYDMPGFGSGKIIVAGYAAFSKQCGLYLSHGAIAMHLDDIAAEGLKATKTSVTFSAREPISDDLIAKLARASRQELGL